VAAGLLGCLALSGCGGGTHEVLLASQADGSTVTLTYQLDGHAPVTVNSAPPPSRASNTYIATVDLRLKTGTHVRITGQADTTSALMLGCTIAVDAAVKQSHTAFAPATGALDNGLRCTAEGYVGHRPYGLNHAFEVLALAVSVLIVIAALGSLVVSRPRR